MAEMNRRKIQATLAFVFAGLLCSVNVHSQEWYDNDWSFRREINIPNPSGIEQTGFQVRISLSQDNFEFTYLNNDGSDLRITSQDGTSEIPFWIEHWDPDSDTASIWVKLPVLPSSGTVIHAYYGNSNAAWVSPDLVETPPAGPFAKHPENPGVLLGTGAPGATESILPENIVYDQVTGHYWMVLSDQTGGPYVGLVYSDDPTNPDAWYWSGYPITGNPLAIAPHLMEHNGTWYIFYGDRSVPAPYPISVASSSSVSGPYVKIGEVLQAGASGTWEDARVDEPYVLQRGDGTWILIYMGDAGGNVEQIGYATASSITGPYTKYSGNPCIPFGPAGSYDAGTVADPWVYEYQGVYYIGYTVSPTTSSPWQTALATTSDWLTFIKHGIILERGAEYNSFRGAVTRIGDQYVFPYTGGPAVGQYRLCIATQPVFQTLPSDLNNPDLVFDFYDGFGGTGTDNTKWTFTSGSAQASVADGILTMNATSTYVLMRGNSQFGLNYIGETRARHVTAGTFRLIMELGFADADWNTVRIADYYVDNANWQRQAKPAGAADTWQNMAQTADQNWHIFSIYRESAGIAGFKIDNNPVETTSVGVSTTNLPPFLMSYGNTNQVLVDWTRVRKWAGSDPVATVGTEEHHTTIWTGLVSNDWNDPGNWTAGVPGTGSVISVPGGTGATLFDGALTIGPLSEMQLEPGGAVTITGDFDNSGIVSIGSTLASSGSLIVNGTASGNITYNRQLLPGVNSAADWHLAAPPVTANSNTNTGKITTVYQWSEPTGTWTIAGITSAVAGRGYNIRQDEASDGVIAFTGPLANGDVTVEASSPYADAVTGDASYFTRLIADGRSFENPGGRGWNLLGNPYPSAINASAFITANYSATPALSQFDPNYVALYLFDGTGRQYYYLANSTGWPSGNELSETHVQAGQGFFVLAMNDNSAFRFTKAMQEHSTATPMLKSGSTDEPWPGLQLKAKHQGGEVVTTVVYNGSMTTGVDPGYDIGLFKSGQEMEIYTSLALKDNGINYTRQALPLSGADTLAVPVGIDYKKGGEVIFSATTVPVEGRRLWLEDRVTGTFTDLSLKSYTVTIPANTYGTGRFFIIASANTPTSVNQPWADAGELRIWASGGRLVIRGVVNTGSLCEIYDINGRKLMEQSLSDGELNTIGLPAGLHGVVVVKVTDGNKMVSRKIVVP